MENDRSGVVLLVKKKEAFWTLLVLVSDFTSGYCWTKLDHAVMACAHRTRSVLRPSSVLVVVGVGRFRRRILVPVACLPVDVSFCPPLLALFF